MKEAEPKPEPTIIETLNDELRKGTDLEDYPTVELLAERSDVPRDVLYLWLENDREFNEKLVLLKEILDKDPNRDKPNTRIKLNTAVLSFGIILVLDETKKRYTV